MLPMAGKYIELQDNFLYNRHEGTFSEGRILQEYATAESFSGTFIANE